MGSPIINFRGTIFGVWRQLISWLALIKGNARDEMRFSLSSPHFLPTLFLSSTCPRPLSASPCFRFSVYTRSFPPFFNHLPFSNRNSLVQREKEYFFPVGAFSTVCFFRVYPLHLAWNKYNNRFGEERDVETEILTL